MPFSPRTAARLSYIASFAAVGAWYPYLGVFYQDTGFDLATIGLMTALGAAAALVAAPIWGAVADRYAGSPLVISIGALVAVGGAVSLVLVDGVVAMAIALVVVSIAFAGIAPTLDARALETVGSDRNQYGRLRAWGSASFIVAVAFTGALIQRAGSPTLFAVYVGSLVVLAVVSLPLRGDGAAPRLPRLSGIGVVLPAPAAGAVPAGGAPGLVGLPGDQLVLLHPPLQPRRARRAGGIGMGHRGTGRGPDHGCLPVARIPCGR